MLIDRRLALAILSAGLLPKWAQAAQGEGVRLSHPKPFGFDTLMVMAQQSASRPYQAPSAREAQIIAGIDFDAAQKIQFRPDHALWAQSQSSISFFHLSRYSADPVTIHAVENGMAREVLYGPDYFDYRQSHLSSAGLSHLGFSGFRVMDGPGKRTDWLAFQGASYFRSSGQDAQYGISARGIAVNTADQGPEEFPRFSQFWLEEGNGTIIIYALLEGPSLTGAYRFEAAKSGTVVMDVTCRLFIRAAVKHLGVAPLTSMYWYGENERPRAADWRPEIHDSDGLALLTGKGERIWRPLIDPPRLLTNSFFDEAPRGFGLMQRDRDFADYQDDGAFYEKRPGLWVEPKGNWGKGAVQLVEIPTEDETLDNIVAFWNPAGAVKAGDRLRYDYRLYWQNSEPDYPADIARVVATRQGRGGYPGQSPWPRDKHKFVVDFAGGALRGMAQRYDVTPVVTTSRGIIDNPYVIKVVGTDRWRALFDLKAEGNTPVDLRLYLKLGDKTLSETWLYQYFPTA